MNINYTKNIFGSNDDLKLILLPIAKNDSLSNVITSIANDYNFSAEIITNEFKAEAKEQFSFFTKNVKIVLLGLGQNPIFIDVQNIFRSYVFQNKHKVPSNIGVNFNYSLASFTNLIEAAVNGMLLGRYAIGLYKSETTNNFLFNSSEASITIISDNEQVAKNQAEQADKIANTQLKIYDLVNNPSNKKTPKHLAQVAQNSGKEFGYDVKVFDKQDCIDQKFDALLSVNKGSPEEPVMIVMEYKPESAKTSLGLVGKGVTFDTGGISIKPSTNMHYMKSDMGGAAAVIGAIELIAKLKLPVHVVAVVPSTENCVDGNSIKPGDVINSYLGKTIEVIDTDAEGRLILSDALAYLAKNYTVDSIIDFATLTGSCLRTFGYICSGLFSNDDQLAENLFKAGEACGERMWRLPIWDAYSDDLKSDIADLRNFSGKPSAGAISAAKFLEVFVNGHTSWAHLDIAGTAFSDSEFASQKISTAYGIRLIFEYLQQLLKTK